MDPDLPALLAIANEHLIVSLGPDLGFIEKNIDPKRTAGAPLTFNAMTDADHDRFACGFRS